MGCAVCHRPVRHAQTIGHDFDIAYHGRTARTGRVGKRHMSDLRNDVPEQLDVFAENFRADS